MKKVLGLAAAGLLAAGAAQAGNITVANSDITLYGGVSAAFDYTNADHVAAAGNKLARKGNFHVTTFAVGLMKKADPNKSPIGFNAAFASFQTPTVFASDNVVNVDNQLVAYGKAGTLKPWLAYLTVAPVEGVSIDAGLLWNKFGEAPLTILNPNYTRGILFTGHPVAYAGARVNVDVGAAKVYVGYNQGGGVRQGSHKVSIGDINGNNGQNQKDILDVGYNIKDAIEAGIMANLEPVKVGLHLYSEARGRHLYVACVKGDAGVAKWGLEFDYTKLDKSADVQLYDKGSNTPTKLNLKKLGADDKAWGIALNLNFAASEQVSVPVRVEYVNNGGSVNLNKGVGKILGSGIYLTGQKTAWSFTITPTWKPTKNTFARVEYSYVKTDKKVLVDDKGNGKNSRSTFAFEAGFLF